MGDLVYWDTVKEVYNRKWGESIDFCYDFYYEPALRIFFNYGLKSYEFSYVEREEMRQDMGVELVKSDLPPIFTPCF